MRPKLVILQSQKKLQVLEKKCDLQKGVRKFFLNKWVSRYLYLSSGDFKVPKNCSSQ